MIVQEIFYGVKCDRCREIYEAGDYAYYSEKNSVIEDATDNDWIEQNGKHYCPDCYTLDEETDEIIINPDIPDVVNKIQKFILHITRNNPETREKEDSFELSFNEYHPIGNAETNWITSFQNVHFERTTKQRYSKILITIKK